MHTLSPLLSFSAGLLALVTATSASLTGCNVTTAKIPLPAGQTILTVPSGVKPEFIAAGFGTQNYSCSTAGKFTSIGAVAVLLDASCAFEEFQLATNTLASTSVAEIQLQMRSALGSAPVVLGRHYFVNNPLPGGTGISPTFDFRANSQEGNPNAFVITSKIGDIVSPVDPTINIDWLELQGISGHGTLAKNVFRILTAGGQPPSSCTPGSPSITVPYAANYWFFN